MMENWNCKQRAHQWAKRSLLFDSAVAALVHLVGVDVAVAWGVKVVRAVTRLMLEAHAHGYEKGYREGYRIGHQPDPVKKEKGDKNE